MSRCRARAPAPPRRTAEELLRLWSCSGVVFRFLLPPDPAHFRESAFKGNLVDRASPPPKPMVNETEKSSRRPYQRIGQGAPQSLRGGDRLLTRHKRRQRLNFPADTGDLFPASTGDPACARPVISPAPGSSDGDPPRIICTGYCGSRRERYDSVRTGLVVARTVEPKMWVIVSDRSLDGTDAIVGATRHSTHLYTCHASTSKREEHGRKGACD